MSKKLIVLSLIGVFTLLFLGFIVYLGFFQQAISAGVQSESDCLLLVKDWCAKGYSCTACSQKTLSYYLKFGSTSTNRVWNADCTYGLTGDANHQACKVSSAITSHSFSHCSAGNVYWYNSIGVKEDLRFNCGTSGCVDDSLDTAKCKVTVVKKNPICWSSNQVCSDGTNINELCKGTISTCSGVGAYCSDGSCKTSAGITISANPCWDDNSYCVSDVVYSADGSYVSACKTLDCSAGNVCVNDAKGTYQCIAKPSCSNKCSVGDFTSCNSDGSYNKCELQSNGCYDVVNKYCPTGYSCDVKFGQCVKPVIQTPVCSTDFSKKCVDSSKLVITYSDCTTKDIVCDANQECIDGSCSTIAPLIIPKPLCDGITCEDYCDATNNYISGGNCDSGSGKCVYTNIETTSTKCLPTPETPTGNVIDNTLTGNVVLGTQDNPIPVKSTTTTKTTGNTFIDDYGLYIGIAILIGLIIYYIMIPEKKKRK